MLDEQNTEMSSESIGETLPSVEGGETTPKVTRTRKTTTAAKVSEPPAEPEEPHLSSFAPKGHTRKAPTRRKTAADAANPLGEHTDADAGPEHVPSSDLPVGGSADQTVVPPTTGAPTRRRRTSRSTSAQAAAAGDAALEPGLGADAGAGNNTRGAAQPQLLSFTQDQDARGGDAADDPIAEALNALGRSHRVRTRHVGVVSESEKDSEAALDHLAQAIASSSEPEDSDDDGDGEGGTPSRRRRRRRGGRKRRRDVGQTDDSEAADDDEDSADAADASGHEEENADDAGEDGARHRRRRRRRRGEDVDDSSDEDAEIVVKVREPRSTKAKAAAITGIDGSTRLEAKKQRRREGRAASRRRAPILSEAEFLARRESVERKMLIRQKQEYSQIAVVEDGVLVEHYVDRASAASLIGNIYLGKVQNVLPGMEAAFIDIGRGRNAVLYAGEVDWDSFGEQGQNRKIEDVFSSGQLTVVQVSKDPVGAKGARLTSHISIPGRYIVYAPKGHISGISRKLSETERNRLKSILDSLVEQSASVVIRTAAEGASEDELVHDINRLKAQWEVIEKKSTGKQVPQLLYAEPDLTMRIVRDLFTEDFSSLIVDGNGGMEDAYETVEAYVHHVAPHLAERIQRWDRGASGDLFSKYRVDEQIAKALDRKVHLPSGGSLVIDRTEALTVIDVNTGKFTGSGGNLEATVTSNNLEAAEEIVRQLRLRDIGGIIIIDFIDMVLPSNRELLLRRLVECLGRDRTRHQVSEVTSLGLVQLTRKKVGTGLAEAFTKVCEACDGLGHIRFEEPVENQAPADGGERHPVRRGRRRS